MSTARKVLVTEEKVYADSLPHSLRHASSSDALEDAKSIAHLLSHVVCAFATYQTQVSEEAHKGMVLVVDLLIDKLDIGSEQYKFPTISWGDNDPALVERKDAQEQGQWGAS